MADDLARIGRAANLLLRVHGLQPASPTVEPKVLAVRAARARFLLRSFEDEAYRDCHADKRKEYRDSLRLLFLPPNFEEILDNPPGIGVYEVGPREQVQQVSSVSRVANNLSLALSLAAAAPSAGAGTTAATNYSRQPIGRGSDVRAHASINRLRSRRRYHHRWNTLEKFKKVTLNERRAWDPAGMH
jgi:hypothetical protein